MLEEEKSLYDLMDDLRANYASLSWYGKLLFPSKIATLIEKYEDNCDTFLTQFILEFNNNTYTAQKQTYPLWPFYHSPYNQLADKISQAGLLTGSKAQANCQSIIEANDIPMRVIIIDALERMNMLNQDTFESTMSHAEPCHLQLSVMSLEWLQQPHKVEEVKTYLEDDASALTPEVLHARRAYEFNSGADQVATFDPASTSTYDIRL